MLQMQRIENVYSPLHQATIFWQRLKVQLSQRIFSLVTGGGGMAGDKIWTDSPATSAKLVPVINVPTQLVPSNLRSVKFFSNVTNALSLALKCGRGIILVELRSLTLHPPPSVLVIVADIMLATLADSLQELEFFFEIHTSRSSAIHFPSTVPPLSDNKQQMRRTTKRTPPKMANPNKMFFGEAMKLSLWREEFFSGNPHFPARAGPPPPTKPVFRDTCWLSWLSLWLLCTAILMQF